MFIEFFPIGAIDEMSSTRRISFFFVVEVARELYTLEGCALTVHLTNSCIYYLIIRWTTRLFYFIFYFFECNWVWGFNESCVRTRRLECNRTFRYVIPGWERSVQSDIRDIIVTKAVHSTLLAARARKYYYRKGLDPRRYFFLSETHTLLNSSTLFCEIVSAVST